MSAMHASHLWGGVPWQLKLFTVGAVLYLVPSVVLLMVALMGDDRVFEAMESMRFYTVFDFCKFVAKVYFVAECTVIRTPSGERPSFRKYPLYSSFVFLVFLFDAIPVIYMLSRGEDEGEKLQAGDRLIEVTDLRYLHQGGETFQTQSTDHKSLL